MNVETLAQTLHEAGREAVERNLVVRNDVARRPFVEWADLTEEAREGRRLQARYLIGKGIVTELNPEPAQKPAGLTVGRIVHYVPENGEHRAAIVVQVPGTLLYRNLRDELSQAGKFVTDAIPGLADLAVFAVGEDFRLLGRNPVAAGGVQNVTGVFFDPDEKRPGTWHWIEREEGAH